MTGTTRRGRAALVLALAAAVVACSRAPGDGRRDSDRAWIAAAADRHRAADDRLDRGDVDGARRALLAVVDGAPAGGDEDRRQILQDTYYRLARLDLDRRDAAAALDRAERGLALGRAPDLFVANLLVARGAAHEALGNAPAAADDFHQALLINETLLDQAAGPEDAGP